MDKDGIHPFSIDASTGSISLTDFDDLDREGDNDVAQGDLSQLYNAGYYQLFVRVADSISTEEELQYSTINLYETSIVNVKVADISTTPNDDDVLGSPDRDFINGLAGDDTIDGLAGNDTINGSRDSDRLLGSDGNDVLRGGIGDDTLNGGRGDDLVSGGNDNDLLFGRSGNDTLNGGTGDDRLFGGFDEDILIGLYGKDTLNGGSGDDILKGKEDNDVLAGGTGNDILQGGTGLDRLHGGAGEDIFVLEASSGRDLITDFEDGIDTLELARGMSFEQISIVDVPLYSATAIQNNNSEEVLAVLRGVEATLITEADFA